MSIAVLLLLLGSSPELDAGRVAFSAMRYQEAVEALGHAKDDASLPVAERVEALDLLARAHLALGRPDQARLAWDGLLALNPMAPEPTGAPKVRASFRQAKAARFAPHFLELSRRPSSEDVLELELVNPWGLEVKVELWEATAAHDFEKRALPVTEHRVVSSLAPGSRFYLRAVAPDGQVLSTLGAPTSPLLGPPELVSDRPLAVAERSSPPLVVVPATSATSLPPTGGFGLRRWVGVGLGVVGLVAAIVGVVVLFAGIDEVNRGEGWPLNGLSMDESDRLSQTGLTKEVGGSATGLVGVAAIVTGLVLLLVEPHPPTGR